MGEERKEMLGGGGCDPCEVLLLTRAFPHLSLQDQVEQTSPRRPGNLAGPGFPAPPDRLANHQGKDRVTKAP